VNNLVIMLFGISSVGKTVTGKKLAEKLKYPFLDLDEEIKKRFKITLEQFMKKYPFSYERSKIKGKILKDLLQEHKDNMVIAVSPIFYAKNFNSLLEFEHVIGIELQDSEEHIFQRLVFSDENDNIYEDDAYKEKHKDYYIKEIHEDIVYARKTFKKITNKCFINNRSVEQVVDELMIMIENIFINKLAKNSERKMEV
jgi:shikimate kinase